MNCYKVSYNTFGMIYVNAETIEEAVLKFRKWNKKQEFENAELVKIECLGEAIDD